MMKLFATAPLALRPILMLFAGCLAVSCASARDGAPVNDLDDEVEIGYGTQDRDEVTGSVGTVTADDVAGKEVTRIEDMINGRIAGLVVERLPGGGLSLRIRGASTIMGSSEPLLVIDGFPISGPAGSTLLALNPSDIERIDVLKDAGTTAIYGSRGANGVILVTTKRAH